MAKRILILQLARYGDILQTLPAVQAFKKADPNCFITFVARSTFSDAARLSPHIDELVELPSKNILGPAIAQNSSALRILEEWIQNNFLKNKNNEPYDLLINLTFSESSSYLAEIIPAREKRGICRGADGSINILDPWSQYLFAQVQGKNLNLLHINDIFLRICGFRSDNYSWPVELVQQPALAVPHNEFCIGIQCFASQTEKSPQITSWLAICSKLIQSIPTAKPLFFGGPRDVAPIRTILEKIGTEHTEILAGKFRFSENLPHVKRCKFIISPDTALVHLASLCQVPVIYIGLGSMIPEETGPYGNHHHVLYANGTSEATLAEAVTQIILNSEVRGIPYAKTLWTNCRDQTRRNEVVPINFIPDEVSYFFAKAYYLLSEFRCSGQLEEVEIPTIGQTKQKTSLDHLLQAHESLCSVQKLAEFGQHYCLTMLKNLDDIKSLREWVTKLTEVEGSLTKIQHSQPLIRPLIDHWKVSKDASPVKGLENVIVLAEGAYRELAQNTEIILSLMQTAVDSAQEYLSEQRKSKPQRLISKEKEPTL